MAGTTQTEATRAEAVGDRGLIIFDFNNLAHRCAHIRQASDNWGLLGYMIFSSMYDYIKQTSQFFDSAFDVVLALDSTDGYWRREIYPPYKADRAKKRAEDGIDWTRAYSEFARLLSAIKECLPWKVLRVSKCEADDIIYVLSKKYSAGEVIIHSSDSDYLQLASDSVHIYQPHTQEYVMFPTSCKVAGAQVDCVDPAEYLYYAVMTGQGGKDNVYNVKTDTNWDVDCGKRKPGFGVAAAKKLLSKYATMDEGLEAEGLTANYLRNKKLIDMSELPEEYIGRIWEAYADYGDTKLDLSGFLANFDWVSLASETVRWEMTGVIAAAAGIEVENKEPEGEVLLIANDAFDFEL